MVMDNAEKRDVGNDAAREQITAALMQRPQLIALAERLVSKMILLVLTEVTSGLDKKRECEVECISGTLVALVVAYEAGRDDAAG